MSTPRFACQRMNDNAAHRNGAGRQDLCAQANVRSYPTWTFQATRREGVPPLETLATPSGFMPPAAAR